jgi:hypothetical protein
LLLNSDVRRDPSRLIPRQRTSPLLAVLGSNSGDCANSLTQSSPRNSIPCSSKTRRILLRFCTCIEGVLLPRSLREIADCERSPHWSDNSRTDQFSNARAARICGALIGGLKVGRRLIAIRAAFRCKLSERNACSKVLHCFFGTDDCPHRPSAHRQQPKQ